MDARELKEHLGSRAKDIISSGLNAKLNKHDAMLCPFHSDSNPSFSWYEEGNTFKCWACNETMDIYRYYTEFGNMEFHEAKQNVADFLGIELAYKQEKKIYVKATESDTKASMSIVKWFETERRIPKDIVEYWNIGTNMSGSKEEMIFRHYDVKGKLVLNAYRDVKTKAFRRETGNKTILWGMEKIDFTKPCIMTEGHPDAMAVSIVYKNVVSIPAGINNLDWIENCWSFIDKVPKFIIWADNDNKNGIEMAENIRKRIGNEKCVVEFHHECKDANDLLIKSGIEELSDFVDELLMPKVTGLINMGRRRTQERKIERFKCGFYDIDRHLKGLEFGCLSILFARDNEGKSTFISQMIAELLKQQKVFLYSGELTEYKVEDWIMSQIIAGEEKYLIRCKDEYGDEEVAIKSDAKSAIAKWYKDKFYLYESKMDADTSTGLFDVMEQAFKIYGVRVFFIDNLMCAVEDSNIETVKAEASFVKKLKNFALTYNVHIFLIAHPNKNGSVEHVPLSKVDVNGSKVITNIADYVFAIERSWNPKNENLLEMYRKPVEDEKDKFYTTLVRILKNRSKKPRIDLYYRFHVASLRFFNSDVPKTFTGAWKQFLKPEPITVKYYNGTEQTFEQNELTEPDPF